MKEFKNYTIGSLDKIINYAKATSIIDRVFKKKTKIARGIWKFKLKGGDKYLCQ